MFAEDPVEELHRTQQLVGGVPFRVNELETLITLVVLLVVVLGVLLVPRRRVGGTPC